MTDWLLSWHCGGLMWLAYLLNRTSTTRETMTSCPDDMTTELCEKWTDMITANAVETEVAIYLTNNWWSFTTIISLESSVWWFWNYTEENSKRYCVFRPEWLTEYLCIKLQNVISMISFRWTSSPANPLTRGFTSGVHWVLRPQTHTIATAKLSCVCTEI